MTKLDRSYRLPEDVSGVLRSAGDEMRGTVRELLEAYRGLRHSERKKSVIMFDRKIGVPRELSMGRGEERLNLFDGEGDILLPYLD